MEFKPVYAYKTKDYSLTRIFLHGTKQTLIVKTAVASNKVRILLTNKYSPKTLRIRKMFIKVDGIEYRVLLNNKKRFKLSAGEEVYSNVINLYESDYDEITVTTYFGLFSKAYSASDFNSTKVARVKHLGIFNREVNLGLRTKAINKPHLQIVILVKQIELMTDKAKTIVWLGDSLTNHSHYTQAISQKLINSNQPISILNAGQSGNRLLKDGRLLLKEIFGVSTLSRIEEDVFKYNQPDVVVVAIGVNDLIHPATTVSAEEMPETYEMIDGYLELLKIIRSHNAKAAIATITPFNGYKDNVLPEAEERRQEINLWIRGQQDYDLVIDIDGIVREEDDQSWLKPVFRGDDNLHFPKEGGEIIAEKIDLDQLIKLVK